ncbi:MAG: hypothetical protein AAGA12_13630 [Pseudomonadota bacterium]
MTEQPERRRILKSESLFLEDNVYRRRRLTDAVRFLPVLAAMLFLLPAMFAASSLGGSTALHLVYFFFVWFSLILIAALLARNLGNVHKQERPGDRTRSFDDAS